MSTHGHERPRGRRRGGRRRVGGPPPETPDQETWQDQPPPDGGYAYPPPGDAPGHQPPPGGYPPPQDAPGHQPPPGGYPPPQDPAGYYPPAQDAPGYHPPAQDGPGYGTPPAQEGPGYGHQAAPRDPGGYGHQTPPQDPAGYGHQAPPPGAPGLGQPPAQEGPGYGHQAAPRDPGGYGHQTPPQDPAGYGHQAPPQDPAGYQPPQPDTAGYGHQAPPQDPAGYQPPAQDAPGFGQQAPAPGEVPPPPPPGPSGRPVEGRRRRSRAAGHAPPPGEDGPSGRGGPPAPGGTPAPGGGRRARRAEQQRRTKRGRLGRIDLKAMAPVPLLVTLAVLAVFIGAGQLTLPEDRSQLTGLEPATASVTASRVVCPDAGGAQVGVVAPGNGKGEVTVQPVGSSTGSPLRELRQAPGRAVLEPATDADAVVASAEGGTAQGFEAEQYYRKDKGAGRGLSDVRCVTPSTNWWFTGAATTGGNQTDLFLSNIDRSAATVDILAYGSDGAIDPEAGQGITVDPGQRLELDLTELAPELPVSAVRVVARTGRVAASMRTQVKDGDTSYGSSWVPPSAPRKGNLVVPAVPSGAGKRKLVLFSPGQQDATVNVRLSTPDGSFAPAGHDKIDVPAQQAVQVDLGDVMSKNATALQLGSEIPLVAAVVAAEGGSGDDGDVAYSAGAQSLSSPGVVAYVPAGKVSATLQLTAPTKDAEVELRALTDKVSGPKRVKIGAGKTVPVKLSGPAGESTYGVSVTQRPGSGPVYGSRVLTASPSDGPLMTVLPLQPGVREVTLPPVVPEVGAGVPR